MTHRDIKMRRKKVLTPFSLFFKLTLLMLTSVVSMGEDNLGTDESNSVKIFTCKDRCGATESFPCSCQARCLVHKNCCEGMASDCPEILEESRARFGHLLNAELVCHESHVFMITSCPQAIPSTDSSGESSEVTSNMTQGLEVLTSPTVLPVSTKDPVENNSESWGQSKLPDEVTDTTSPFLKKNETDFEAVLRNVPVIDMSNGFVYKNRDIFLCNGANESDLLGFDIEMKLPDGPEISIQVLDTLSSSGNYVWRIPSRLIGSGVVSECVSFSKGVSGCTEDQLMENPELEELCSSFISYTVVTTKEVGKLVFNNRFCLQCSQYAIDGFDPLYNSSRIVKGFHFSILLSISKDDTLILKSKSAVFENVFLLPWNDATCKIKSSQAPESQGKRKKRRTKFVGRSKTGVQENEYLQINETLKEEQVQIQESFCSIQSCTSSYHLASDGICKREQHLIIGVSDDGFPLSPKHKKRLPDFVVCGLKKHSGIETIKPVGPAMVIYDDVHNRSVYVVNISTLLPVRKELFKYLAQYPEQTLFPLLNIVKAFKEFRKTIFQSECRFSQIQLNSSRAEEATRHPQPSYPDFESLLPAENLQQVSDFSLFPEVKEVIVDEKRGEKLSNFSTTVCIALSYLSIRNRVATLECVDDYVYETDKETLRKICDSPCFSLFNEDDLENKATDFFILPSYILLSGAVSIIFKL